MYAQSTVAALSAFHRCGFVHSAALPMEKMGRTRRMPWHISFTQCQTCVVVEQERADSYRTCAELRAALLVWRACVSVIVTVILVVFSDGVLCALALQLCACSLVALVKTI